ncbi:uncharacterized protein LOC114351544 isoform X2 [Ostrinia furnacalis]|uniref:uncharacterized protein LOC114351544 isoform X2 n=1 Tax=Ostrinia furnacalis TaxID=93504 RepID=UPI00103DBFAA|nr:uncharacterized protein LOC114351544 isoform X2 [Ostrinia furnacalis]XP_028158605.1 uncharacterized protein LOC114351544 isoform X2 [Ostrinia furnacalis]
MAKEESCLPRTAALAAAILILLSASGECLQCYWCGPLAEQVHRRERAPPCDKLSDQVTACDPGYTHCATVASSPPFVESRYCVKFYQDECYLLHCNSTNNYRMTCPCRGDLCNGPKTDRETDAFNGLVKIVARNRRLKRNAITSSTFINSGKTKMNNIIENDEHEENAIVNDKNNETDANVTAEQPTTVTEPASNITMTSMNTTPETQIDMKQTTDEPKMVESSSEASKEMPISLEVATTMAEALKIDSTTTKAPEMMMKADVVKEMVSTKAPETMMKSVDVKEMVSNEIKPSMQLPTAEALQQNDSPATTEKSMEQMTDTTTLTTTTDAYKNGSPMPPKSKNDSAAVTFNPFILICILAFSIIL